MNWIVIVSLLLFSCKNASQANNAPNNIAVANAFIDAFYSFNRDSLENLLTAAKPSQANILYYQRWAECGNYIVLNRSKYFEKNDSVVIFPVTVKDDLAGALNLKYNVTDTFHIVIQNGKIRSVNTSSNDPELYYQGFKWIKQNRKDLIEKPCEGWGKDPAKACACVRGVIKGFTEFIKTRKDSSR